MSSFIIRHIPDSFKYIYRQDRLSFDVTITDPPYPENVQSNLVSGSLVGTKNVPKYNLNFDPLYDYEWIKDVIRITKRWSIVFCALESFGRFELLVKRPTYVRSCVWYKKNAMGQLTRDRPASAYEGIATMHNPDEKLVWNGIGSYGVWSCASTRGLEGRHPNEKPIFLALKLVALFSNRGETVFDPFCGSAAIGEACLRLGRNYIGLDKDEYWVQRSRDRLKGYVDGLFAVSDEEALGLCSMKGA